MSDATTGRHAPELSIVTTLYCSAPYIDEFYERVTRAAESITRDFEIVFVNDGSPDDSLDRALALMERDARVRVIDLSRNFGHFKAVMTGLEHARGKLVYLIDCDLEEDPENVTGFHRTLRENPRADVVYGIQARRKGGAFERITGAIFYRVINAMSDTRVVPNHTMGRLMTRRYVRALIAHRDREVFLAGLWALTGFEQIPVPVEKRSKGSTTYTLGKKISVAVNAITSFSNRPLVWVFYLGCFIMAVSATAAGYLVIRRLFFGTYLAGWPSLIVSIWFLGGLMIFSLGVIGIYISKIFIEAKERPYTVIREIYEREPLATQPPAS